MRDRIEDAIGPAARAEMWEVVARHRLHRDDLDGAVRAIQQAEQVRDSDYRGNWLYRHRS